MQGRPRLAWVALGFGLCAMLLVVAETALRIWAHHHRVEFEAFDPETETYRLVPGTYPSSAGGAFRINEVGLRGPPLAPPSDARVRVVAVGDSVTFGADREDRTWPAQLQTRLDPSRQRFEVLNAGVAGADSGDALRRYVSVVAPLEPDLVIVYIGWNDLMKTAPLTQQGGSLGAGLVSWLDSLWLVRGGRKLVFHHARGWISDPDVGTDSRTGRFETFVPQRFEAHLRELVAEVRGQGARPVLVTLGTPLREGMSAELIRDRGIFFPFFGGGDRVGDFLDLIAAYNRVIRRVGAEEGVEVADLAASVDALPNPTPWFWDTMHLNHRGQAQMADFIWASLARAGVIPVGGRETSP